MKAIIFGFLFASLTTLGQEPVLATAKTNDRSADFAYIELLPKHGIKIDFVSFKNDCPEGHSPSLDVQEWRKKEKAWESRSYIIHQVCKPSKQNSLSIQVKNVSKNMIHASFTVLDGLEIRVYGSTKI